MSDNSSDTSVGSSPYQSDENVMTFVMVGEAVDTDDVACPTPVRHVGNEGEQSTSGATHKLAEQEPGNIVSIEEENIRLRKRIEDLESFFDRMSVSTADSGFGTARSSLASSNKSSIIRRSQKPDVNRGDKMKGALKRLFTFGRPKETEGVARPTSVLRVGHDMEYRTKEAAHALATQVTTKRPRVDIDIHAACKEGDLGRLRRILSENLEDVNHRDKDGLTPVMIAALFGHRRLVDVLVKKRATMYLLADNKNNILHVACIGGDKDMVKYVLSQKVADINSRGEWGSTPLMIAAAKGHREVFDLLVSKGADLSLVDDDRDNILHMACIEGHVDMVKYVLSQKVAGINSRGQYGSTPLMMAANMGHREVFDFLVSKGADLSLLDDDGDNILHMACIGGHDDIVKYVLSQKVAGINSRGECGRTPLMIAAAKGHREVFDLLVSKGANLSLVDDDGDNILHMACIEGHVDMVKYVLSQKVAGINSRGECGRTPLMMAAAKGHREVFDFLVSKGADLSLLDDNGDNILHMACIEGHVDMVKYVLSQKVAGINSRGQCGRTPLMMAANMRHREVFDFLVSKGADLSLLDDDGDNILHMACIGGHDDIVKYVLSQKVAGINSRGECGSTALMMAAAKGHRDVFDLLVSKGADVSLLDDDGDNNLHVACIGGHVDMVKYVLSQKVADINSRNRYRSTPVMIAAAKGQRAVFDFLVSKGADLSLVDDDGDNILHMACIGGHVDMVKYVLSQKVADINIRNRYGNTPVMMAAAKGQRAVFDFLVSKGADVSLLDDDGNNTPHMPVLEEMLTW